MCGIAGIVTTRGFDPQLLFSMTELVAYRGPDAFGYAFFPPDGIAAPVVVHNERSIPSFRPIVGLGHRRLSIIDLSEQGHQPMKRDDGNLCITYNGEVYNFVEIRTELESRGHRFRTRTDTEVILAAYREWGEQCFCHFNGMWSIAIWDRMRYKLVCSRDRFGVKPFYYHLSQNEFIFGSEIKQVLVPSTLPRRSNPVAVAAYLEQGVSDYDAETFFSGVYQLPAGHILILEMRPGRLDLQCHIHRYWELSGETANQVGEREAIERFRAGFSRAVSLRLRSDVPVGSCLSGGLDSSSIVCQARQLAPSGDLHTFSSCIEDQALDERPFIAEVVAAAKPQAHFVFPHAEDFWKEFDDVLWHQDEPFASTNVYAQWCVMRDARRMRIPVLLDGQGGDETLCGYLKFYVFYLEQLLRRSPWAAVAEATRWLHGGVRSLWSWDDSFKYLPGFVSGLKSTTRRISPRSTWKWCESHRVSLGCDRSVSRRQKADLTQFSLPVLLRLEDRNSMAHSIETRLPFLDYELAEFLVSCPPSLKLRDGWSKWILRAALADRLPEKVRTRRTKLGFDTPLSSWMELGLRNGAAKDLNVSLRMERFLLQDNLKHEIDLFLNNRRRSLGPAPLFRALCLERWARLFHVN